MHDGCTGAEHNDVHVGSKDRHHDVPCKVLATTRFGLSVAESEEWALDPRDALPLQLVVAGSGSFSVAMLHACVLGESLAYFSDGPTMVMLWVLITSLDASLKNLMLSIMLAAWVFRQKLCLIIF